MFLMFTSHFTRLPPPFLDKFRTSGLVVSLPGNGVFEVKGEDISGRVLHGVLLVLGGVRQVGLRLVRGSSSDS